MPGVAKRAQVSFALKILARSFAPLLHMVNPARSLLYLSTIDLFVLYIILNLRLFAIDFFDHLLYLTLLI